MKLKLREIRKLAGLTMKELGDRIGCSESAISQYETGKRHPDYETLLKISDYFGVSVDDILGAGKTDQEMEFLIQQIKDRSELRELITLAARLPKAEVEQAIRIIGAIRNP